MDELRLRFDKKFTWGQNKPILFAEGLLGKEMPFIKNFDASILEENCSFKILSFIWR